MFSRAVSAARRAACHKAVAFRRSFGLLKGLNPILTADLLHVLRSAGHGDEIVVVDCNFPAESTSLETESKNLVTLAGVDVVEATDAICSVMPIDAFVDCACFYMSPNEGDDLPDLAKEVHAAGIAAIQAHAGDDVKVEPLARFDFYDRAEDAFAIVQAGAERRPYGNFVLKKGVVGPDGNDLKP